MRDSLPIPDSPRVPLLLLRRITASIENARSFPIYAELYKKALQSKPVGKEVHVFFKQQRAPEGNATKVAPR
ncbi:hypothetical protein MRX96_002089 [Rhipicephalus microplus]